MLCPHLLADLHSRVFHVNSDERLWDHVEQYLEDADFDIEKLRSKYERTPGGVLSWEDLEETASLDDIVDAFRAKRGRRRW